MNNVSMQTYTYGWDRFKVDIISFYLHNFRIYFSIYNLKYISRIKTVIFQHYQSWVLYLRYIPHWAKKSYSTIDKCQITILSNLVQLRTNSFWIVNFYEIVHHPCKNSFQLKTNLLNQISNKNFFAWNNPISKRKLHPETGYSTPHKKTTKNFLRNISYILKQNGRLNIKNRLSNKKCTF